MVIIVKKLQGNQIELSFDTTSLQVSIRKDGEIWEWSNNFRSRLETEKGTIYFTDAKLIEHKEWKTGVGTAIVSHFEQFIDKEGKVLPLAFDTIIRIEDVTQDLFFEWIPLEEGIKIQEVYWPGYMKFDEKRDDCYTLLNIQQGLLIPNTWKVDLEKVLFDGQFCTAGSYMPWFGQVKRRNGYLAICEQPWDASYYAKHSAKEKNTFVGIKWRASLGKMEYRRVVKYCFLSDCDYNDLCKVYRGYVKEKGRFCSLEEKAAKCPSVNDLIGCGFIHKGIKTKVQKDSDFFDPDEPEKNNQIIPFSVRTEEIKHYKELGMKKLYLHLDGWAEPGYDNEHPDYLPACIEAGGWEGMKELADTIHNYGYLFGIHDQYRDYYFSAKTFDENSAARQADGTLFEHSRWAGGHQTYLCTTQAPYYVKRNFNEIKKNGITLDCAYLDVFTCNEGDECSNPWHKITRRESYEYRNECFEYLLSQQILPSSEEVSDWSIKSLVFCHYAPYYFMLEKPDKEQIGIPVPLFNLVYHDCVIEPWIMEKFNNGLDYMLYALLNGGAPYFIRDGAYPNTDGAFGGYTLLDEKELIKRCEIVTKLHEKVAKCEMVSHQFLDGTIHCQKTIFSDGTVVMIDLKQGTFSIQNLSYL